MDVPYFTYDYLKDQAAAVLSRSKYATRFPVAIELIVEQDFKMDVVPIRGLQGSFNIDAFISSDMSTISVDEFVLENRLNRYRFSLAHELGHRVLHSEILQSMDFDSVADWKSQITQFPERAYGFLEYQANTFANCLLVPSKKLDEQFDKAIHRIKSAGLSPTKFPDECLDAIATELGKQFEVSREVILNRLTNKHENFQQRLL